MPRWTMHVKDIILAMAMQAVYGAPFVRVARPFVT
jgi:hypothetical protein